MLKLKIRIRITKKIVSIYRATRLFSYNYLWFFIKKVILLRPGNSLTKISVHLIKAGDIVIDIGANDGSCSFIFSRCVGKMGKVYAIEPNKILCEKIREQNTLSRRNNIKVFPVALSNKNGEINFYVDTRPSGVASSLNLNHVEREMGSHGVFYEKVKVTTNKLDDFCNENGLAPNFIKIDVEGAEADVIEGGIETLKKHKPIIWFELWCGKGVNNRLEHIQLLRNLKYQIYVATLFHRDGIWFSQSHKENPRKLVLLEDSMLQGPCIAMDILALPIKGIS